MQDALLGEQAGMMPDPSEPVRVEEGVWRVPIPLPFGAHAVNVYLLRGRDASAGWCMVDCAIGTARAEEALRLGFERAGIGERDISDIVLTHSHPDHVGAAGYWQRATGATVHSLPLQVRNIPSLWDDPANSAFHSAAAILVTHGMPADEAQALITQAVEIRGLLEFPAHPVLLAHHQRVHLAGNRFQVFWTPGHADGHIALLRDDGVLVAGDAILPPPMRPTIGWYPWSRPDPLHDELETLALLADLPARLVLPGHGSPFSDLRARADELAGTYTREIVVVARLLADAPAGLNAYVLAHQLYEARWHNSRSRLLAISEAVARLEHLRLLGRAERDTREDGTIIYQRTREDGSLAADTNSAER